MAFSLRLDPETEARIRELAETTGRSKAAVVRAAMAEYAAAHLKEVTHRTALDRLRPYIGIVDSGGLQLSTNTHEKFRAILEEKQRKRRERRSR